MTLRGKLTRPPSPRASAVTTGSSHPASSSSFSSFASLSPSSASPLPARDPPPSARPSPGSDTLARFAAGVKFASPRSSLRLNHCWSGTSVLRFPLASTDDADAGAASPSGPPRPCATRHYRGASLRDSPSPPRPRVPPLRVPCPCPSTGRRASARRGWHPLPHLAATSPRARFRGAPRSTPRRNSRARAHPRSPAWSRASSPRPGPSRATCPRAPPRATAPPRSPDAPGISRRGSR